MWNAAKRAVARAAMLALATVALATVALALPARAQANCQWYATTALKQQQDNERLKCGFKGLAWHTDLKAHLSWCASVPPEAWRSEAKKREQELSACATKARK